MKVLRRKRRLAGINGLGANTSGPVQVTNMGGATQVAAGQLASYAVHTVLRLVGQAS
jgi:hypothetical protein